METLQQAENKDFKVRELPILENLSISHNGISGDVLLQPCTAGNSLPNFNSVPCGLPPIVNADLIETLENRFFSELSDVSINDYTASQKVLERSINTKSLFHFEPTPCTFSLPVKRDIKTGTVCGYSMNYSDGNVGDSRNSSSLTRTPAPSTDFVKGRTEFMPFVPGGMESNLEKRLTAVQNAMNDGTSQQKVNFQSDFLHVAPGMEKGLAFNDKGGKSELVRDAEHQSKSKKVIALNNLLSGNDETWTDYSDDDQEESEKKLPYDSTESPNAATVNSDIQRSNSYKDLEEVLKIKSSRETVEKSDLAVYAEMVDINSEVTDFHSIVKDMARKFPFELDIFQKQAVLCLENHDSVFVAAHTSAGKTVVAEYAIALCQRHMTRAIYTSPIKSLSNQKFRDFKDTFEDVGILTGDVQINPEATCLIMTTEILRSMLYRGADLIRDVEWVIFDEVHYVNDAERGVVWEEVIIMLPDHVNLILLSATVPNTFEFAEWIGRTKKKKVFVINTAKRPVPLEHYLFTGPVQPRRTDINKRFEIDQTLHKILDSKKQFSQLGYKTSQLAIAPAEKKSNSNYGPKTGKSVSNAQTDKNLYSALVNILVKHNLVPTVIFTFSKKRCESNAQALSTQDLTNSTEKSEIRLFFNTATKKLKGSDRTLPQVMRMESLLTRGIGVHHGGLLPILKEVVEILFCRGLVKILFATETFAMGVNMPAKAVVFDSIRKHDGTGFRDLLPGEYIQMAGRAGRRGLDTTGTVIIMCKNSEVPEMASLAKMMTGVPTRLESQFRLTYNMIINLLRVEAFKVEDMMKRSFSEYATQKDVPSHEKEIKQSQKILSSLAEIACIHCTDLQDYHQVCSNISAVNFELQKAYLNSPYTSKVMRPGRILVLNNNKFRNSLCSILSYAQVQGNWKLTVFVLCDTVSSDTPLPIKSLNIPSPENLTYEIATVNPQDILFITKNKVKMEDDVKKYSRKGDESITNLMDAMVKLGKANKDHGLEPIDGLKEFKISDYHIADLFGNYKRMLDSLPEFQCSQCPDLKLHYNAMHNRVSLEDKMVSLRHALSDQNLTLLPEYHQRVQVLQLLNYIDEDSIVQLKGRVACEVNTCDEVIVTELIFENVFSNMQPEQIVALLSCMVCQERNASSPSLTPALEQGKDTIIKIATSIAETQIACGLDTPIDVFLDGLNFALAEVVYEWARGMPFSNITELTDVQEGSIVRCIVRLDEACRDVRNAARVIGDPALYDKLEEASAMIKRDIVFAASLYTA